MHLYVVRRAAEISRRVGTTMLLAGAGSDINSIMFVNWHYFLMTTLRLLTLSPCLTVITFAFSRSATPG